MHDTESIQPLLQAVDQAGSASAMLDAVEALAAARSERAIPKLIEVLGYNNPGAAVAAVDGLVQIGTPAVQPLLDMLDGYNYGARAWAVRALAGIADPRGLEILVDAAQTDFALSVRRAAARGLGMIRWQQMAPEQIEPAQSQVLDALNWVTQDGEWVVRYAGVVGFQGFAEAIRETRSDWRSHIISTLSHQAKTDESLAVRSRAIHALHHL